MAYILITRHSKQFPNDEYYNEIIGIIKIDNKQYPKIRAKLAKFMLDTNLTYIKVQKCTNCRAIMGIHVSDWEYSKDQIVIRHEPQAIHCKIIDIYNKDNN